MDVSVGNAVGTGVVGSTVSVAEGVSVAVACGVSVGVAEVVTDGDTVGDIEGVKAGACEVAVLLPGTNKVWVGVMVKIGVKVA